MSARVTLLAVVIALVAVSCRPPPPQTIVLYCPAAAAAEPPVSRHEGITPLYAPSPSCSIGADDTCPSLQMCCALEGASHPDIGQCMDITMCRPTRAVRSLMGN